ncbi:OmpA family protein [Vibrio aestuarianus]|uniref:OmpA family protein n=1 Tax=Vibrio aestuarianus TaxID=28171 RepID=UPI00237CA529|nr:OmpA family protein [Vibrio aestuarianus]MDE1253771.1 OmpA family protein [Vibrio aestuarianus]MDE1340165.1 OmpA family protein [Vibrio aestuarianus]
MKKLAAVISASLIFASSATMAEVYLGGKVGKSWLDDACRSVDTCDDDSSTVGVFLGYQALDWLSIEAGYDYLGEFSGAGLNDDKVNVITLAPKFSVPLGYGVELYAKVGGAYVDYGSEDDYSYLGAAGLEFNTDNNLTFRVEYQAITDINNDLVRAQGNSATLGVAYKFGGSKSEPEPMMVEEVIIEEVVEEPVVVVETTTVIKSVPFQSLDGSSFEHDSSTLTQQSEETLDKLVTYLNTYPQSRVEITGHTDSTGAAAYNQKLSEKRAQAVADAVIAKGIEASRITAKGEGESKPIASNDTVEGRKLNRRVDIVIPEFEYGVTN